MRQGYWKMCLAFAGYWTKSSMFSRRTFRRLSTAIGFNLFSIFRMNLYLESGACSEVWNYMGGAGPVAWLLAVTGSVFVLCLFQARPFVRFELGAPITRNRVYILLVKKVVMERGVQLKELAESMKCNFQMKPTVTWSLDCSKHTSVRTQQTNHTYTVESKAGSAAGQGPLTGESHSERIHGSLQEEQEQKVFWLHLAGLGCLENIWKYISKYHGEAKEGGQVARQTSCMGKEQWCNLAFVHSCDTESLSAFFTQVTLKAAKGQFAKKFPLAAKQIGTQRELQAS